MSGNNILVVMWGRDTNFQISIMYELRNRKNTISLGEVFFTHPLRIKHWPYQPKFEDIKFTIDTSNS